MPYYRIGAGDTSTTTDPETLSTEYQMEDVVKKEVLPTSSEDIEMHGVAGGDVAEVATIAEGVGEAMTESPHRASHLLHHDE